MWGAKVTRDPPLSILHTFYIKKVSIALQCAQAIFILSHVITIGEGSSKLGILSRVLPFCYLICFSRQEGIQEFDVPWWFALFWWFFLDMGPSFLFLVVPPLFGCFDLFMVGRVSSNTTEVSLKSWKHSTRTLSMRFKKTYKKVH